MGLEKKKGEENLVRNDLVPSSLPRRPRRRLTKNERGALVSEKGTNRIRHYIHLDGPRGPA